MTLLIQIYSLVIISIIFWDYHNKFKEKNNKSILFFSLLFIVSLIAILNCIINILYMPISLYFLLCILALISGLIFYFYIQNNIFKDQDTIKAYDHYLISYIITSILLFGITIYFNLYTSIIYLWLIIPLLYILLKGIIKYKLYRSSNNYKIIVGLLIAITCIIIDMFIGDMDFLCAGYTIVILILYIHRSHSESHIDPMTKIYNRGILPEAFNRRANELIAAYLIDVDKFKYINDTYGHSYGDKVLISVADILLTTVRKSDFVVRFGGDEFLIIAYIRNKQDMKIIYDKINGKVKEYNVKSKVKLSLSIGYDMYESQNKDLDTIVKEIDKKMYDMKNNKIKKEDI